MNFARRIAEERERCGLTQGQLASLLHVDKSEVSHYENGRRKPRMGKLLLLANILGISVGSLLEGETVEKNGVNWGFVEAPQEAIFLPYYQLTINKLEFTGNIPTEAKLLQQGLYIWISIDKLSLERLIINQNVRILVKGDENNYAINDLILFRNEGISWLGEIAIIDNTKKLICGFNEEKFLFDIAISEVLGKVVQVILDM